MHSYRFSGAMARAYVRAAFLALLSLLVVVPQADAAIRHHWHPAHHHHRARIAIDVGTGAIELVRQDPFAFVGSLFQPPVAAAQAQLDRDIAAVGKVPAHIASMAVFIAEQARARGMDAAWAIHVCMTEGCKSYVGDRGSSFGPFQLHYGGIARGMRHPGLGDKFTAETGLDARDPHTWRAQVIFALDWARVHGWQHDWFGYQRASVWEARWAPHRHRHANSDS